MTHLDAELDVDHFKIVPYHKTLGDAADDGFDDYRLGYALTTWLADCRKHCDVDRLRWFLRETETFCTRTFGGHTVAKSESSTLREFVLSNEKNWDVALTVFNTLPRIQEEICLRFMKMVWDQPTEHEYDNDDLWGQWRYASKVRKSHLRMYRKTWQSYKNWNSKADIQCTQIRLEARSGLNGWYIGVCSRNKRCQGLGAALREVLGASEDETDGWPWWQWVDETYRNWDTLIPVLHQECSTGTGHIKDYFVKKLNIIAEAAIPIIDEYEGT